MQLPVKIYIDGKNEDGSIAYTTTKDSTIYNVHALNELRNFKLKDSIKIEDESAIVQAGVHVCIKTVQPDGKTMHLVFVDFSKNGSEYQEAIKTLSDRDAYLLSIMQEHIINDYESLKKEIFFKPGEPVTTNSMIKVVFANPALASVPMHVKGLSMAKEALNKVMQDIRLDILFDGAFIEYDFDPAKGDLLFEVVTGNAGLRAKMVDRIQEFLNLRRNGQKPI